MSQEGREQTMDVTSINVGRKTRDLLREYRDEHEFDNYNEAIRSLLQYTEGDGAGGVTHD